MDHHFPFKPLLWLSNFPNVRGLFLHFYSAMLVCQTNQHSRIKCAFLNCWVCNGFHNRGGLVLPYYSLFQSFLSFSHFLKKYINFKISSFGLTEGMSVWVCVYMYKYVCMPYKTYKIKTYVYVFILKFINWREL